MPESRRLLLSVSMLPMAMAPVLTAVMPLAMPGADPVPLADATLSSLRWGLESNKLGLEIEFSDPEIVDSDGDGDRMVTMVVKIPLRDVVLVPRGDLYVGMVRLYVAVADTRSRVALPQQVPVSIRIPAAELEEARGRFWTYRIPLRMRAGSQRVTVGARDDLGATESFVGARVEMAG